MVRHGRPLGVWRILNAASSSVMKSNSAANQNFLDCVAFSQEESV